MATIRAVRTIDPPSEYPIHYIPSRSIFMIKKSNYRVRKYRILCWVGVLPKKAAPSDQVD